jgi:hypothetical protein
MEVSSPASRSCRFTFGESSPYPLGGKSSGAPEPAWTLWIRDTIIYPAGNRTPAVQSVDRRYCDWVIPNNANLLKWTAKKEAFWHFFIILCLSFMGFVI